MQLGEEMRGRVDELLMHWQARQFPVSEGMKALFVVNPTPVAKAEVDAKQGKRATAAKPKRKRPINYKRLFEESRPVAVNPHYKTIHVSDDRSNGIERAYDFVRGLWLALRKGGAR
jgi:hypothetical protein